MNVKKIAFGCLAVVGLVLIPMAGAVSMKATYDQSVELEHKCIQKGYTGKAFVRGEGSFCSNGVIENKCIKTDSGNFCEDYQFEVFDTKE